MEKIDIKIRKKIWRAGETGRVTKREREREREREKELQRKKVYEKDCL